MLYLLHDLADPPALCHKSARSVDTLSTLLHDAGGQAVEQERLGAGKAD